MRTQTTNNDNGSWNIEIAGGVATIVAQGPNTRNMMQYNKNNSLFSCYAEDKPQQSISIYKVNLSSVEDYILNVTKAGWATLYLAYDVVIPKDVNVYYIAEDAIADRSVTLTQIENGVIPANTAVIVEAEAGEYTFVVTDGANEIENIMLGTTKDEYIDKAAYVLGVDDEGVVGLYKAEMNGGVWLNNANKAYLPASVVPTSAQGAASFSFRFGEGTTGVENVEVENEVKAIFDLTGRRVEAITERGVYIVGGKKVLVK